MKLKGLIAGKSSAQAGFEAGLAYFDGKKEQAEAMLARSREEADRVAARYAEEQSKLDTSGD